MNKLLLHRLVSFLLLTAVMVASVPAEQVFHKHNFKAYLSHANHFKKTEKPCCKPFEAFSGDVVKNSKVKFIDQPAYAIYRASYFVYFIKPLFDISNKAPPVSLA